MRMLSGWLLLALAVAGTGLARERLVESDAGQRGHKELLYVPNGKYLRAVSLGHAPLVADVVYLWAIQYYSDYDVKDRYVFVEHIFGDVIAELDPHYVDPYWLGAIILTTEAKDLDGGLRLLDKGFANNPTRWILPYLGGWEAEGAGQFDRAADYFDRAAHAPGAPADLFRLKAGMAARGGNLREAIARWNDVLENPRTDDAGRSIASRQIRTLTVKADLQDLDAAVAAFKRKIGHAPHQLEDLLRAGIVDHVPFDPDGKPYVLDPVTGQVSSPAGRVLSP